MHGKRKRKDGDGDRLLTVVFGLRRRERDGWGGGKPSVGCESTTALTNVDVVLENTDGQNPLDIDSGSMWRLVTKSPVLNPAAAIVF